MADPLKGRDLQQVLKDGARLRVWYEEEGADGPRRVPYDGRVTSYNPSLGLRVWFDGFSASEQEWVNDGDEWDWEEPVLEPVPEPLQEPVLEPAHVLPSPATDYQAVRLRMRGSAGQAQIIRLPHASQKGTTVTACSSLSLGNSESSPSKFNKKARLLRAGIGMEDAAAKQPAAEAGPSSDDRAGTSASGAASSGAPEGSAAPRARAAAPRTSPEARVSPAAEGAAKGASTSTAPHKRPRDTGVAAAPPSKASRQPKHVPPAAQRVQLRISASGVHLGIHSAAVLPSLTMRANDYPPADETSKYGTCALSGLPARYCDPKTGRRYGSLAAFKQLRKEAADAEAAAVVVAE